jgi:hypothetical protein
MTHRKKTFGVPAQPTLPELMAGYLERQTANQRAGLCLTDNTGETVPFEAVPAQPVDPRLAWDGALAAIRCFKPSTPLPVALVPPDWPFVVAGQDAVAGLAFAVGNFPQLVRSLQSLLQAPALSALQPAAPPAAKLPALEEWAARVTQKRSFPDALLALGVLRLARQLDQATELMQRLSTHVPADWRAAWANEEAACAWHKGHVEEAAALWESQPVSAPVLFNRGMAALFRDKPAEAGRLLSRAVNQLAEDNAWHHLARFYMALVQIRS